MKDQQYTEEQIVEMFSKDETIDFDFKNLILTRLNATKQAMYNCVHEREKTMTCDDTHGDLWVEEHNRFVQDFQRYHN